MTGALIYGGVAVAFLFLAGDYITVMIENHLKYDPESQSKSHLISEPTSAGPYKLKKSLIEKGWRALGLGGNVKK